MPIRHQLPKNPDPERYIQVNTREGKYLRLKRGLNKPATLNQSLKNNASVLSISSPVAKRIILKMSPYTQHLKMGRIHARLNTLLMRSYKQTGRFNLSVMHDMDLQPYHPFSSLATIAYNCGRNDREVSLEIRPYPGCVQKLNSLVTDYYFDAVLLYGQPDEEHKLRVDVQSSNHYTFGQQETRPCSFSFTLPKANTPFALFMKLSLLEGNEMAYANRHYGMKVVLAG